MFYEVLNTDLLDFWVKEYIIVITFWKEKYYEKERDYCIIKLSEKFGR